MEGTLIRPYIELQSPKDIQVPLVVSLTVVQMLEAVGLCAFGGVVLTGLLAWLRARRVSVTLQALHDARMAERDRIARDLHDTILQSTEGLLLKVYSAVQQLSPTDPTRDFLIRSLAQAEQLAIEGRQKLLGLKDHTQTRLELSQALAALGVELSADTNTAFSAVKCGRVRNLTCEIWDEVFGIAREAISNAFKHARAEHIEAEVTYGPSSLAVRIRDDGRGMVLDSRDGLDKIGHFGVRVMRERAAQLQAEFALDTRVDQGTMVTLVVPRLIAYRRRANSATMLIDR
jgi:signal transduction histidine kinase